MAITFQLQENGVTATAINLVYDSSTNTAYQEYVNSHSLTGEINPLFHKPDTVPPELVRLVPDNRVMFFRLNIDGSNIDDTLNKINALARWIDGEDQQAARYHTDGDVNRIEVKVQLNGSTNHTLIPVVYGFFDSFSALLNEYGEPNGAAINLPITLIVDELGEGASISLNNDLASSPHFVEDSDGDGLADGWTETGTPATTIDTTAYLIGGKSQKVVTDNSTSEGVRCDTVTASISSNIVAYAWVYIESGGDPVRVRLFDGASTNIDSATLTATDANGVSDKTAVDAAGNTWYRVPVSGSNTGAANVYMDAVRQSGDASANTTYYVDACYLEVDQTVVPDAWCSTVSIKNRYDPGVAEININYLDFWGIPGDADAVVQMTITSTGSNDEALIVSGIYDGVVSAQYHQYWIEDDDFTFGASSDWAQTTSTGTSGDSYMSLTLSSVLDRIQANSPVTLYLTDYQLRVFAGVYVTTSDPEIRIGAILPTATLWTDFFAPSSTSTWSLVDFGLLNPSGLRTDYPAVNGFEAINVDENAGSGGTVRVDFIMFLPTQQFAVTSTWSGTAWAIDGKRGVVLSKTSTGEWVQDTGLGSIGYLLSGTRSTRYVMFVRGSTTDYEVYDLTATLAISSINVIPRTRHLLGVS